ncbi:tail fiber assembly protein [Pseudomonas corrugata]|uniref:Tail fiber assembly protein n=1 Tax=Pseudomonas corrugata TaxID=47879 RepID=A0A8B6UUM0_9PSED|nr:tail fiber assembly protein [Pseudomonas corrugata]MDU9022181.1 tail fiber assembly protein [Pseudomonas corrugata]QTH15597.1 tail fiber assembly protein [Pseudomonas corrugata]UZD92764.1 tail fiber assembly protein [Pseudomonas corrugata]UZD96750.1 tail fiber assembly protein [Pseudomonas corrugata]
MDVAFAIERLLYAAQYFGSLTANTRKAFDDLTWNDERPKPTWEELEAAWAEMLLPDIPQLTAEALVRRDELLGLAALRIAPLQGAVDLDQATSEEVGALTAWKQYQVDVNRVTSQVGFPSSIDWPVQPS